MKYMLFNKYNKCKQKYRDPRGTRGDIKKSLKTGTERINMNKSYIYGNYVTDFGVDSGGLKTIEFTCFRE